MYRKDWIMRQIEGMAAVLARVLGRKSAQDYKGAQDEISAACRQMLGMDVVRLATLSDETLLLLFTSGAAVDTGRCLLASILLAEQGDLEALQGREGAAVASRRKALALMLEAQVHDRRWRSDEYMEKADSLLSSLAGDPLAASLRERLTRCRDAWRVEGE